MKDIKKIIIIGGVAGGASAAARLRRLDENAEIILFERGEYISFANCGLPYYIGDEIKTKSALLLQTPESFNKRFNIDVRINTEVTAINRESKKVIYKNNSNDNAFEESYDYVIISTGSSPITPPIEGANLDSVFTLRSVNDAHTIKLFVENKKPASAVIVGGGAIGLEIAENLNNSGVRPIIVEGAGNLVPALDFDMACGVHSAIRSKGIDLKLNSMLTKISESNDSMSVQINGSENIDTDMVILSIGSRPEGDLAKKSGLMVNERGAIQVDERMKTSDEHIYAVGDAVEITEFISKSKAVIALAGPANKQGRIAADNICGIESVYDGSQASAIIKIFDKTVAVTGINEKQAKRFGIDYEKSFTQSPSHATYYPGASFMTIKTIFEKSTGKILGAQIVGSEGVDKRCDVIATAIRFNATAKDLAKLELCYAPPYSSAKDPVNMAGFTIDNILTGKVKIFHWHEIESLPNDGSVIKLDTRTPEEFNNGHIQGFINIPLDELRNRLDELDINKEIYVTCQIGLRGYVACRILSQNGFNCYNLSGGYSLYQSIYN